MARNREKLTQKKRKIKKKNKSRKNWQQVDRKLAVQERQKIESKRVKKFFFNWRKKSINTRKKNDQKLREK